MASPRNIEERIVEEYLTQLHAMLSEKANINNEVRAAQILCEKPGAANVETLNSLSAQFDEKGNRRPEAHFVFHNVERTRNSQRRFSLTSKGLSDAEKIAFMGVYFGAGAT